MATSQEHQARSKYETFSLESSYLARGQARRVEALTEALEQLQQLPLTALPPTSPVLRGALVRLEGGDGTRQALFIAPSGGGEQIVADGEAVTMMTSSSPLGRALLGKTVGASFDFERAGDVQTFTVLSVE